MAQLPPLHLFESRGASRRTQKNAPAVKEPKEQAVTDVNHEPRQGPRAIRIGTRGG